MWDNVYLLHLDSLASFSVFSTLITQRMAESPKSRASGSFVVKLSTVKYFT